MSKTEEISNQFHQFCIGEYRQLADNPLVGWSVRIQSNEFGETEYVVSFTFWNEADEDRSGNGWEDIYHHFDATGEFTYLRTKSFKLRYSEDEDDVVRLDR